MGGALRRLVLVDADELAEIVADREQVFDYTYDESPAPRRLDLGDSWPALGKLPLDFLVTGLLMGLPDGDGDFAVRLFSAAKVKQIAAALADDPGALGSQPYRDLVDQARGRYQALRSFLRRGAADDLALLVWLD